MADEPTTTPPAGAPTEPQAGNPPAPAAEPQQPPAGGVQAPADVATLQRELSAARREAAGYRTKLKGYEDATKSESEKQAERIADLERQLTEATTARQAERLQMAAFSTARRLGFRNPELAYRMLNPSEIDTAEDGTPKNVDRLLEALAKAEPYLVSSQPAGDSGLGPRGAPATPGQGMNDLIRRAAGRT